MDQANVGGHDSSRFDIDSRRLKIENAKFIVPIVHAASLRLTTVTAVGHTRTLAESQTYAHRTLAQNLARKGSRRAFQRVWNPTTPRSRRWQRSQTGRAW